MWCNQWTKRFYAHEQAKGFMKHYQPSTISRQSHPSTPTCKSGYRLPFHSPLSHPTPTFPSHRQPALLGSLALRYTSSFPHQHIYRPPTPPTFISSFITSTTHSFI